MGVIIPSRTSKPHRTRGQAMVEFAVAMPVLLLMLYGIMEFGRMVFMYSLVNTASRDAARYASAYGYSEDGYLKYKYCAGIKKAAQQSAYIVSLTSITIKYYDSSGNSKGQCSATSGEDGSISLSSGDRVTVTVQATYTPLIRFLKLNIKPLSSTNSRTIFGIVKLGS